MSFYHHPKYPFTETVFGVDEISATFYDLKGADGTPVRKDTDEYVREVAEYICESQGILLERITHVNVDSGDDYPSGYRQYNISFKFNL